MPFGSYEEGPAQAFRNAARLMAETSTQAVKIEGGVRIAEIVAFLVAHGIFGGYRVQGRGEDAERVAADARAVAEAGAFAVVLEKVPEALGTRITAEVAVPTIGIGAGAGCDGQILVVDDMLGIFEDFRPKFVRRYAELGHAAEAAIAAYATEVRARSFPGPEHAFGEPA
jgi:3-methyl-2-oxobutanoate hydroxymethyltransferase